MKEEKMANYEETMEKSYHLIDQINGIIIKTLEGTQEDDAWVASTSVLATCMDTLSVYYGHDPKETRELILKIGPKVDKEVRRKMEEFAMDPHEEVRG